MINILFLIIAYLIGSFPSAVFIGKAFYDKDVREYGSGNAGATNTFRVLGFKAGVPVLFLDVIKGVIAVSLARYMTFPNILEIQITLGFASVIGHLFPVFTGFRGGKGIATLLGVMIAIAPFASICCIVIFLISFFLSRYVSLSSILSSISFPLVIFFLDSNQEINFYLFVFSIFVPVLALITHQKNIERLIRGEENKVKFDKK